MSAYIVQPETINRIVTFLSGLRYQQDGIYCHLHSPIAFENLDAPEWHARQQALAEEMLDLNVAAVRARYLDRRADYFNREAHGFVTMLVEPWQVLKSLDCFLYQCSEGDIPKHELFCKLDKFRTDLARVLASDTAEYKAAKWA